MLAAFPGFGSDLGTFQAWSRDLAANGPWNFYDKGSFVDWTPGYLYILWLFGLFDRVLDFSSGQFEYLLKLPPIAADLASVYLLYLLLEGQKPTVRLGAALLYALHPALLLVGPVWAQVDSVLAFFLLFTIYNIIKGRLVFASVVYVVGFLTKPQAVAALPLFTAWILRDQIIEALRDLPEIREPALRVLALLRGLVARLWRVVLVGLATALLIVLPFFPDNPLGIFDQLRGATEVYPYSTFFAYNFWGMLWTQSSQFPQFPSDASTYWGIDYRAWGYVLFAGAILAILIVFRKARGLDMLALATALSVLAFFVFLTRMHERYLFPFFLPFLAAAVLTRSRMIWAAFIGLSVIHFFNLYYVYSYYNPNFLKVGPVFDWIGEQDTTFLFSLLTVLAFPALLVVSFFLTQRERERPGPI